MDGSIKGKAIAITTTNGTRAIRLSEDAEEIIVGSFLNLSTVVEYLKELQLDVIVVCAGWKGNFNLEDTLYAGALAERLQGEFTFANDATLAALYLYKSAKADMFTFLQQSSHVQRLLRLDITKDVAFCLQQDTYNVLPVWKKDRLVDLLAKSAVA